jgi:hypothetical protein
MLSNVSKMTVRWCVVTAVAVVATSAGSADGVLAAQNWPQWRGPNLNGTTDETGLPTVWSATENVAWTLEVSDGSGTRRSF